MGGEQRFLTERSQVRTLHGVLLSLCSHLFLGTHRLLMERPLDELIDEDEPAIELIREWVASAQVSCTVLPPSQQRAEALLKTPVTTRSPMGAVVYETGGILVDNGWIRFLGSGHPQLARSLPDWNQNRSIGYLLVADDAAGGFFGLNGGAFPGNPGSVHYWAPDSLEWEDLDLGYTDLLTAFLSGRSTDFYDGLRWPSWQSDLAACSGDQCFTFYPFLWTKEGDLETSTRAVVPASEAFDLKSELVRELGATDA